MPRHPSSHVIVVFNNIKQKDPCLAKHVFFLNIVPLFKDQSFLCIADHLRKEQYLKPMQFVWSVYVSAVLSNGRGPALTAVLLFTRRDALVGKCPWCPTLFPSCSRFSRWPYPSAHCVLWEFKHPGWHAHSAGPGNHRLSPRSLAASGGAPAGVWCPRPVSEDPRMAELIWMRVKEILAIAIYHW